MTKVLTAFDSDDPQIEPEEAEKIEKKHDYVQVFEALVHSLEVANTVFARCAKKHFRQSVNEYQNIHLVVAADAADLTPIWVTDSRVLLSVSFDEKKFEEQGWAIRDLVDELARVVISTGKEKEHLDLIDPLTTKIAEVGDGMYSFSVKQRWSVHG